jgi:acyl-CoA synthetase (AMP-forming)/AMP-acid ligase II
MKSMAHTESSSQAFFSDSRHKFNYAEMLQNPLDLGALKPGATIYLSGQSPIEVLANIVFYRRSKCTIILGEEKENYKLTKAPNDGSSGLTLGLVTSGTSGIPKLVLKDIGAIFEHIESKKFNSRSDYRWGLLFDHEKMAGLQVILHAFTRKESLVCPALTSSIESKISVFVDHSVTALSATPSMWRQLLNFPTIKALNLKQITLGGEKSDSDVLNKITGTFPSSNISQIYASTELGEIFTVRDGKPGFPIGYLTKTFGNRILEIDQNQNLLVNENGKIFNTGDVVELDEDRVYFSGRSDALINVGGEKVDPSRVENALLEHPAVAAAFVAGLPNKIIGNLVCANIVPHPGRLVDEDNIKQFLSKKLNRSEIPAIIVEVAEFSLNSNGKRRLVL